MKLDKKQIFTIPNLLSTFRIVLAFVFLAAFYQSGASGRSNLLTAIILLSALTDFLDGKIARKFNMVSELGKILDPIADKITQGVLILCLMKEYSLLKWLFLLFAVKEAFMGIVGVKVLKKNPGKQRRHVVRQGLYRLLLPGHAVASFHPRHAHEHRQHFDPGLQLFHGPVIYPIRQTLQRPAFLNKQVNCQQP